MTPTLMVSPEAAVEPAAEAAVEVEAAVLEEPPQAVRTPAAVTTPAAARKLRREIMFFISLYPPDIWKHSCFWRLSCPACCRYPEKPLRKQSSLPSKRLRCKSAIHKSSIVSEGFPAKLAIFHKIPGCFLVTFSNCSPEKNRT